MAYETLVVERHGPVGWLEFDRPHAGNAMDAVMMAELPRAWRELDADDDVRCVVVTGRGKAFQTGLDMAALARDPASLRESSRRTRDAALELTGWHLGVRTPVVVAVNGVCAGGGLHFVVDADVVLAARHATFLDPHVSVGQVSAWEAIGLTHRMAATVAARLALIGTHERLDAARAHRLGLVGEVVDGPGLRAAAQRVAESIARGRPEAARRVKRALWRSEELGLTAARTAAREDRLPTSPVTPEATRQEATRAGRRPDQETDREAQP
ncbi:enoyl-CoA hydratase/isomerase family protein [Nonomuraea cavernae]|uniref:enoyl-CoA hydratase/isomerase family protein n=1 Tax=Nonomuraea cavernae TaxID=2045107 RepID=UPI0016665E52|nr:enoyl-CoA hydratase/isomerase family protein [Nonomuraea cavernae]MCA2186413.1 enoyl-CoA hydratase/isomerase family protein [Nonomuraea cavernae]